MEGIPVREAYEIIRDNGVEWLAGKEGSDRIIKSVNVIEIPDCYEWIQGGEMMLTTLYPYKTVQERTDLIRHLNKGNAACVLLHPGNEQSLKVPNYLIDLSNMLDFHFFWLTGKCPILLSSKNI